MKSIFWPWFQPSSHPVHVGQSIIVSGQSGQYGEKHEPQLKSSNVISCWFGSMCPDPWTRIYRSAC
ncbi:unnamed protein product [Brassica napus]|nr:unnamed protein product [Brassica napus]